MKIFKSNLILVSLLMLLLPLPINSRNSIDSLRQLVNSAEGDLKSEYRLELARKLLEYSKINEGITLAEGILNEFRGGDNLKIWLQAYSVISRGYLLAGDVSTCVMYSDSTMNLARKNNDRYGMGLAYQSAGTPKVYMGDAQGAFATLDSSLVIFTEDEYPIEHALSKLYYASVLATTGEAEKSIEYLNDSKRIFIANNDRYKAAAIDLNIGLIKSSILGLYEEALNISLQVLPYFESVGDSLKMATCSNTIANCYDGIENFDKAIEYYKSALSMMENNGNVIMKANFINNLGEAYKHKEDFESAQKYYSDALELFSQYGIDEGIVVAQNNIGECMMAQGYYTQALSYFKESLSKVDQEHDYYKTTILFKNIGDIYLKTGKLIEAGEYYKQSVKSAKILGTKEELYPSYQRLSEVYEKRGNYREAYKYHKLYSATKDQFIKSSNAEKVSEIETRYQTDKKEKEIELLTKNQQIQNLKLSNQQTFTAGLMVVLALIIGFSIILYKRYVDKRNMNKVLEERNKQIEAQKNELKDINEKLSYANDRLRVSETDLKHVNATKDKFFSIIAHDLKGPFSSLLGLTQILSEDAQSMTEDDMKKIGQGIYNASRKAYALTENLLEWARAQLNMINIKREFFDFNELVHNNEKLYKSNMQAKGITLDHDLCEQSTVNSDKDMVDFALRNLISNAIKFTRKEGKIKISSTVEKEFLKVQVADTGVGIPEEDLHNLFKIESTFTKTGTEEEEGTGLGLVLVREFIEKIGGEISVESKVDEGTKFTFTIPLAA